jgi:hypothetical protein
VKNEKGKSEKSDILEDFYLGLKWLKPNLSLDSTLL